MQSSSICLISTQATLKKKQGPGVTDGSSDTEYHHQPAGMTCHRETSPERLAKDFPEVYHDAHDRSWLFMSNDIPGSKQHKYLKTGTAKHPTNANQPYFNLSQSIRGLLNPF